jgi:dTDP-4-amino-4,6-dideoxygalactose transaminase
MEQFTSLLIKKRKIDAFYRSELAGLGDIEFQDVSSDVEVNCWLFTFKTHKMRELLEFLNENGVQARPFWMPMNQLDMFEKEIYVQNEDHSSKIYETCLSIPSSTGITQEQLEEVVSKIKEFFKREE